VDHAAVEVLLLTVGGAGGTDGLPIRLLSASPFPGFSSPPSLRPTPPTPPPQWQCPPTRVPLPLPTSLLPRFTAVCSQPHLAHYCYRFLPRLLRLLRSRLVVVHAELFLVWLWLRLPYLLLENRLWKFLREEVFVKDEQQKTTTTKKWK
jgi:hypothetical protein